MATVTKRGKSWRAQALVNGKRISHTARTRAEATLWGREVELGKAGGVTAALRPLRDALDRYAAEESPKHKGARWEQIRLAMLGRMPIGDIRLDRLSPADMASWRNDRLRAVSSGTVRREMNLFNSVFAVAAREWGWLRANPLSGVKRPRDPPSRRRRIAQHEIDAVLAAAGYVEGRAPADTAQIAVIAFLFAMETAMRSGEILSLTWPKVKVHHVELPRTKNGDERNVPLSPKAKEILSWLPKHVRPFPISDATRDVKFRGVLAKTEISNLHFHDSRAEAIWRLSKKLSILQLAKAIGHRDLKSLMIYYDESPEELANQLRGPARSERNA